MAHMAAHRSTPLPGATPVPNAALTDLALRNLAPPEKGTVTLWDGSLKGFGCRVSQGGAKSFVVLIASGRRQVIGRYPLLTLQEARGEAKRLLAEKTLGKVRPTFLAHADALKEYLAAARLENSPSTVETYRSSIENHFPFGRRNLADVTTRDVTRALKLLDDRPSAKHHAFTAFRAYLNWCVRQKHIDRSPMDGLETPSNGRPRERVLSDDELAAVYRTARKGETAFHKIVCLLVLSGQRRTETAHFRRDWNDRKELTITVPGTHTKNKREHTFPYGPTTAAILDGLIQLNDSPYYFPAARERAKGRPSTVFRGWSKGKAAFDKELVDAGHRIEPWTLHDLRRTFSSGMAALQVRETVTEKLLNHVTGTLTPIGRTYNKYKYLTEMREAVLLWERHLAILVAS